MRRAAARDVAKSAAKTSSTGTSHSTKAAGSTAKTPRTRAPPANHQKPARPVYDLFRQADSNKSGFLEPLEASQVMRSLGLNPGMWHAFDMNHDGASASKNSESRIFQST